MTCRRNKYYSQVILTPRDVASLTLPKKMRTIEHFQRGSTVGELQKLKIKYGLRDVARTPKKVASGEFRMEEVESESVSFM